MWAQKLSIFIVFVQACGTYGSSSLLVVSRIFTALTFFPHIFDKRNGDCQAKAPEVNLTTVTITVKNNDQDPMKEQYAFTLHLQLLRA